MGEGSGERGSPGVVVLVETGAGGTMARLLGFELCLAPLVLPQWR